MPWQLADLLKESSLADRRFIDRHKDQVKGLGSYFWHEVEAVHCNGEGFTTANTPLLSLRFRGTGHMCTSQDEITNLHSQLRGVKIVYNKDQPESLIIIEHNVYCVWDSSAPSRLKVEEVTLTHDNQKVTRVLQDEDEAGLQLCYNLTALLCLHVLKNEATLGAGGLATLAMQVHDIINSRYLLSHNYLRPIKPGRGTGKGKPMHLKRCCPTHTLVQRLTAAPARFINEGGETTVPKDQLWLEVSALLKRQGFKLREHGQGQRPCVDDLVAAIKELQQHDCDAWEPLQLLKCIWGEDWRGVWDSYLSDQKRCDEMSDGNVSICLKCGLGGGLFSCSLCSHAYHGRCLREVAEEWRLSEKDLPKHDGKDWLCPPCHQLNEDEAPASDATTEDMEDGSEDGWSSGSGWMCTSSEDSIEHVEIGDEAGPSSRPSRPSLRRSSTRQVDTARRANSKRAAREPPPARVPGVASHAAASMLQRTRQGEGAAGLVRPAGTTGESASDSHHDGDEPPSTSHRHALPADKDLDGILVQLREKHIFEASVSLLRSGVLEGERFKYQATACGPYGLGTIEDGQYKVDTLERVKPRVVLPFTANTLRELELVCTGKEGGNAARRLYLLDHGKVLLSEVLRMAKNAHAASATSQLPAAPPPPTDAMPPPGNSQDYAPGKRNQLPSRDGCDRQAKRQHQPTGGAGQGSTRRPPAAPGADEGVLPHASQRSTLARAGGPDPGAGSPDAPPTPDLLHGLHLMGDGLMDDMQIPEGLFDFAEDTALQLAGLQKRCEEAINQIGDLRNMGDYPGKVMKYAKKARELLYPLRRQARTQQLQGPHITETLLWASDLMDHVEACLQPRWIGSDAGSSVDECLRDSMVNREELLQG